MTTAQTPSEEQQQIINQLQEGNNVIVDAVAGSGKTTTLLFLASALPDKKILAITYNSRLKAETRERTAHLKNVKVHSYHSLGLEFYIKPCHDDSALLTIIRKKLPVSGRYIPDIIVLDETQDMTPIYCAFIKKAIADMNPQAQILVLGDTLQCIYDFPQKGADRRFLTLADQVFPSPRPWQRRTLRTSYRITKPMEWFVNERMLGYPRMTAVKKSSIPVRYLKGNPFQAVPEYLCDELRLLLTTGLKPDDIFVLAPSIRSHNDLNPIKILENMLVKAGVPCYGAMSDEEVLRDDVIKGKVVFSSFHQSKGLERKLVIVGSFSTSFYFTAKDAPRTYCPNILYVAATRAKEALYLWGEHSEKGEKALPFLREANPPTRSYYELIDLSKPKNKSIVTPPKTPPPVDSVLRRVTDLVRFIPEESINSMIDLCKMVTRTPPRKAVEIPSTVPTTGGRHENVADLNGIAIPTMYEHIISPQAISIQTDMQINYLPGLLKGSDFMEQRHSWISAITNEPKTPGDFLLLANLYSAWQSNFLHKIVQIKSYNWLTSESANALLETLTETIKTDSKELLFEHTLSLPFYKFGTITVDVEGRADLVDDKTLWELKCVDSLKADHVIQLALYAWIWQQTEKKRGARRFCLHNIRTGEVQELTGVENLDYVATMVLDNHFRTAMTYTDEEFIARCKKGELGTGTGGSAPAVLCQIVD